MTTIHLHDSFVLKSICFFFLAVFLLFPVTIHVTYRPDIQHSGNNSPDNSFHLKLSSLTVSNPISISGDSDFANQASSHSWLGDGSSSNPYIIQNLQIINNTNSSSGISISSVTKYFIIQNNYIEMTGLNANGISLSQTSNVGTITNNTFFNNTQYGVYLYYSHNTTVSNNSFSYNKQAGLHAFYANQTTIINNSFVDNEYNSNSNGIYLRASHYNLLKDNIISRNWYGIFASTGSTHNTFINNTFKDNINHILAQSATAFPFYYNNFSYNTFDNATTSNIYFSGQANHNIIAHNNFTNNADGIRFTSNPQNNSVYDNRFINNSYGVWGDLSNTKIYNNTFVNNGYGIDVIFSNYGKFYDNDLINNNYAIFISSSTNGTYTNNRLINNTYAFEVSSGKNNTLTNNYIYNNTDAFDLFSAYNNTLINNTVLNNSKGITFISSYNNSFYGNNFLHNTITISGGDASNKADNGLFGNFWLNYMSTAVDSNSDGIGDVPYTIGSMTDHFPLMIWNNINLPLEIVNANNDVSYNEGDPAFNITWRAIDESPATFTIFENGSVIKSNSWSSFETVFVTLSGLILGKYNFTIAYSDTDGNSKSDTVFVTVYDVTPPSIVGLSSFTYMEDTAGYTLSWNVTDNHPDRYYILKDGLNVQNGTWISNTNITISIDGLLKNTYTYKLFVNDTSNNVQSFTTTVIVYDGTPPNVTSSGNTTLEAGSTNQIINWNATDRYPAYYELYRDGVLITNNSWSSGINISGLIDTSTLGLYNYSIIVFDQSGNNMTDTIFITIVDTTNPLILTYPMTNISFYSGILGNNLSWTAYDLFPANYSILLNSSLYLHGTWTTNVTTNIDSLAIGFYNLTIVFTDTSGNRATQTIWITVLRDNIPPVIVQQPTNITYQDITTNNVVSWTAIDSIKVGNYSLYFDSVLMKTADWINNTAVPVNIDNFSVGLHNVTIVFRDAENNIITDTIWVTVFRDTKSPVIVNSPSNTSYLLGTTGHTVYWTAVDDLGSDYYTVYLNGSTFLTNSWINNTVITVSIDGFSLGLYNLTIVFNDTTGNKISDTIWITVFADTTSPIILQQPMNLSYVFGTTGNELSWTAIDDINPGNYSIYSNGTEVVITNWINNTAVTISIDGLSAGEYNYTIVFRDSFGNQVSNTVWITVFVPSTGPIITVKPSNMTYLMGTTGNNISWTVIDNIVSNIYSLYLNGTNIATNYWTNNTALTISIDGLAVGVYNFTIVFNDANSNTMSDTTWITVFADTTSPIILQQPSNVSYRLGTTGNNLSWTVIDDRGPANYSLSIDDVFLTTNSWQNNTIVVINVDGLSLGEHKIAISFNDTFGNVISDIVYVNVWKDTNPPIILKHPENIQYFEGQSINATSWIVIDDLGAGNYTLLKNGTIFKTGQWSNDTILNIPVDGLPISVYNLTMIFTDNSSNSVIFTFWVTVTLSPISTSQASTTTSTQPTTTPSQLVSTTPQQTSSPTSTNKTITQTTSLNVFFIIGSLFVLMIRRYRK